MASVTRCHATRYCLWLADKFLNLPGDLLAHQLVWEYLLSCQLEVSVRENGGRWKYNNLGNYNSIRLVLSTSVGLRRFDYVILIVGQLLLGFICVNLWDSLSERWWWTRIGHLHFFHQRHFSSMFGDQSVLFVRPKIYNCLYNRYLGAYRCSK